MCCYSFSWCRLPFIQLIAKIMPGVFTAWEQGTFRCSFIIQIINVRWKNYVTYTIKLPVEVMESIHDDAMKKKVSIDEIITLALKQFMEQEKQKSYEEGFKRVAQDKVMMDIAEEGLEDYSERLRNY